MAQQILRDKLKDAGRGRLGGMSSLLVSWHFLAALAALACLSLLCGANALAAFLLFLFLICLASRLWGMRALQDVEVTLDARSACVFAGEKLELSYSIRNNKLLPLIWLELLQELPENECVTPQDPADTGELLRLQSVPVTDKNPNGYKELHLAAFQKKFAYILWYQQLNWTSCWKARKRGIYRVETLMLRSGDGFGLTQTEAEFPAGDAFFVVYPKILPVRADSFLQNMWDAASGAKGFLEDCTVIRSERAYQASDPWKRIDWRMAARQVELQVKVYETILPKSVHFILDAASFAACRRQGQELEETLSILTSLILRLSDRQILCGLSLPRTAAAASVNRFAGIAQTSDLLLELASFEVQGAKGIFDLQEIARARERLGRVYYVAWDRVHSTAPLLLEQFGPTGISLLTYEPSAASDDYKELSLRALKGGEGDA